MSAMGKTKTIRPEIPAQVYVCNLCLKSEPGSLVLHSTNPDTYKIGFPEGWTEWRLYYSPRDWAGHDFFYEGGESLHLCAECSGKLKPVTAVE